jgi:hypothetical protein
VHHIPGSDSILTFLHQVCAAEGNGQNPVTNPSATVQAITVKSE